MPFPLIAAIAPALIPSLAKRGMDLLGGFFNSAADEGVEKITNLIKEKTGIEIEDVAEDKLTEDQ